MCLRQSVRLGALVGLWTVVNAVAPALASDYANTCRTADGAYELDDGVLMRSGADGSSGRQIEFKTISETVLKSETGHCLVNKAPGKKYGYESKSYVLRISFMDFGRRMETDAICELVSDGLPAMYSCDRQVVTAKSSGGKQQHLAGASPAGRKFWSHNGSRMRLDAQGDSRKFVYEKPRSGMLNAGARADTVLFDGTRAGDAYSGTAYIFKKGCAPKGYEVSGTVSNNDRRITLSGRAPTMNAKCAAEGSKDDTLVFELEGE